LHHDFLGLLRLESKALAEAESKAAGKPVAERLGVFTTWASKKTDDGRLRVLPVYVHSKVAVFDDAWSTAGSANLDGLSLRLGQIWIAQQVGWRERACEMNGFFADGVSQRLGLAGEPRRISSELRRRLWAEHLGYRTSDGEPDLEAADLVTAPPAGTDGQAGGWLGLFNRRAAQRLSTLASASPEEDSVRVLPWVDWEDDAARILRRLAAQYGLKQLQENLDGGRLVVEGQFRPYDFYKPGWSR
jgi:phosphatidylserine/phosphatidylglycerophosphate/cardiolipin synthase-like enzyme